MPNSENPEPSWWDKVTSAFRREDPKLSEQIKSNNPSEDYSNLTYNDLSKSEKDAVDLIIRGYNLGSVSFEFAQGFPRATEVARRIIQEEIDKSGGRESKRFKRDGK